MFPVGCVVPVVREERDMVKRVFGGVEVGVIRNWTGRGGLSGHRGCLSCNQRHRLYLSNITTK